MVMFVVQAEDGRRDLVRSLWLGDVYKRQGMEADCPVFGRLKVDVAYGGNFYAIVEPQDNFRDIADYSAGDLIAVSPVLGQRLNAVSYTNLTLPPSELV